MLRIGLSVGFICLQVLLFSGCNSNTLEKHHSSQSKAITNSKTAKSTTPSQINLLTKTISSDQPSITQINNTFDLQNIHLSNQEKSTLLQKDNSMLTKTNYAELSLNGQGLSSPTNHPLDFKSEFESSLKLKDNPSVSLKAKAMEASFKIVSELKKHNKEKPEPWNDLPTPKHGINCAIEKGKSTCSIF